MASLQIRAGAAVSGGDRCEPAAAHSRPSILHNIVRGGFAGQVYAVNPHGHSMEGIHCVASVADLPEVPDLAVIAVPAAAVPEVADACGRRGVRALVVITSGLGAEGADLLAISGGTACGWWGRTAWACWCRRPG